MCLFKNGKSYTNFSETGLLGNVGTFEETQTNGKRRRGGAAPQSSSLHWINPGLSLFTNGLL